MEVELIDLKWLRMEQIGPLQNNLRQLLFMSQFQTMVHDLLVIEYLVWFLASVGQNNGLRVGVDDSIGQFMC